MVAKSEEEEISQLPENVPNRRVIGGEADEQVVHAVSIHGLMVYLTACAQDLLVEGVSVVVGFEPTFLFVQLASATNRK